MLACGFEQANTPFPIQRHRTQTLVAVANYAIMRGQLWALRAALDRGLSVRDSTLLEQAIHMGILQVCVLQSMLAWCLVVHMHRLVQPILWGGWPSCSQAIPVFMYKHVRHYKSVISVLMHQYTTVYTSLRGITRI